MSNKFKIITSMVGCCYFALIALLLDNQIVWLNVIGVIFALIAMLAGVLFGSIIIAGLITGDFDE